MAYLSGVYHEKMTDASLLGEIQRLQADPERLSADETAWLDAYHARARESLTPLCDSATAAWLADATRPLRQA